MKRPLIVGLLAGIVFVGAACGDDSNDPAANEATNTESSTDESSNEDASSTEPTPETTEPTPETTEPTPATTEAPAAEVPTAIISLSPTATEMLYAIDASDQVLAVDDFSNYPPETADKMSGINAYEPNVEAIAGLEPDLVITDGTNPDFLAQLDTLGIAHWEGYAAVGFDDVYAQIEQLGAATGNVAEAAELVGQMQADIDAVVAGLPELDEPLTYYHELDDTFFSVSPDTFIGAVYADVGLVNITELSDEDLGPYPQLNAEFIIESSPDLIFLACTKYCGETAETVSERPGWDTIAALSNGGVIEMDDDIASRWGPRIVEYLEVVGEAVADVAAAQPVSG